MKKLVLVILVLLLPHNSFSYTYLDEGANSCGKFIEAVDYGENNNNWAGWNIYAAYVGGYFTGVNRYRADVSNIRESTDRVGVMAFLEKYCRENPLDDYFDAVKAAEEKLYPKRKR